MLGTLKYSSPFTICYEGNNENIRKFAFSILQSKQLLQVVTSFEYQGNLDKYFHSIVQGVKNVIKHA